MLKFSISGWCQYLSERRKAIVEYAAAKNQISTRQAGRRLDQLSQILHLFDRVELSQRSSPTLVTLTLRVQTAKPLR